MVNKQTRLLDATSSCHSYNTMPQQMMSDSMNSTEEDTVPPKQESFWMSLAKSPFDLSNWTTVSDEGRLLGAPLSAMGDMDPLEVRADEM